MATDPVRNRRIHGRWHPVVVMEDLSNLATSETPAPGVDPSKPSFVAFGDSGNLDAFARLRVSEPFTLWDSKQIYDDPTIANSAENYPLFYDNVEVSGSGTTTTFSGNRASTTLAVANATAGRRVRQTRQRFNYQAGKSLLVILTGVTGESVSGISKKMGYFDNSDGIFFQHEDGVASIVRRTNASGSPVDNVVNQASWNLDTMDGNGASGVTLDFTKSQIFFMDLEWLGVGRVRCGWFIDGFPIYCHEFLNTNVLDVVYMSNPNLPIRTEIENDGTGTASSIETICSTVISEGGIQPAGVIRSGDLGALSGSEIQCSTVNTAYAVCGIRLRSAFLSASVVELAMTMIETSGTNNAFLWKLHFNPTLTTGLTYTALPNSAVEFGAGLPAGDIITDPGIVFTNGYVDRAAQAVAQLRNALRLGADYAGNRDELVLSITPVTANQDILGSLTWQEIW